MSLPVTWSNKYPFFCKTLVKQMDVAKITLDIHLPDEDILSFGKFVFIIMLYHIYLHCLY